MKVVVFGSINLDLVIQVPHLPRRGETVIGHEFFTVPGGKGANQAVALAKLGIASYLVGQVGGDEFGQSLIKNLQALGVNTDAVVINSNIHSGVASVVVDERGENVIACAGGANSQVSQADVERFTALLPDASVVILELGIPMPAVLAAAKAARANGCCVILDPAPAKNILPPELYSLVDIMTPNAIEASQLVGITVDGVSTARQAANVLLEQGVKTVVVTLGNLGAVCSTLQETFTISPPNVRVRDSVAAGDAFNGAMAAAVASGKSLREAIEWGTAAGALAVSKMGAQSSLPDLDALMNFLAVYFSKS